MASGPAGARSAAAALPGAVRERRRRPHQGVQDRLRGEGRRGKTHCLQVCNPHTL